MSARTRISAAFDRITAAINALDGKVTQAGGYKLTWSYLQANWTSTPTQISTIAFGTVYSYTLAGVTRYRLVPVPYAAANDAFYASWNGTALSNIIVTRG